MNNFGEIREKLKKYHEIEVKIRMIELNIEEIHDSVIFSSGQSEGERVQSSVLGDTTANKAMKIIKLTEDLKLQKRELEREIGRVDNALRVLDEQELAVIRMKYIDRRSWASIQLALNDCTYSNVKKIEVRALAKIQPYLGCPGVNDLLDDMGFC